MSNPTLCSDPFNSSLTSVATVSCEGACTKWLHKPGTGSSHPTLPNYLRSAIGLTIEQGGRCSSFTSVLCHILAFCRRFDVGLCILENNNEGEFVWIRLRRRRVVHGVQLLGTGGEYSYSYSLENSFIHLGYSFTWVQQL